MFIVTQKPTFIAPVVAQIPADNGRFEKVKFSVIFKALDKNAIDDLLGRIRASGKSADAADSVTPEPLKDRTLIEELMVGFGTDIVEEDRTPMVFNSANVDRLCAIWPIESAIVKSFFDNYVNGPTKN